MTKSALNPVFFAAAILIMCQTVSSRADDGLKGENIPTEGAEAPLAPSSLEPPHAGEETALPAQNETPDESPPANRATIVHAAARGKPAPTQGLEELMRYNVKVSLNPAVIGKGTEGTRLIFPILGGEFKAVPGSALPNLKGEIRPIGQDAMTLNDKNLVGDLNILAAFRTRVGSEFLLQYQGRLDFKPILSALQTGKPTQFGDNYFKGAPTVQVGEVSPLVAQLTGRKISDAEAKEREKLAATLATWQLVAKGRIASVGPTSDTDKTPAVTFDIIISVVKDSSSSLPGLTNPNEALRRRARENLN